MSDVASPVTSPCEYILGVPLRRGPINSPSVLMLLPPPSPVPPPGQSLSPPVFQERAEEAMNMRKLNAYNGSDPGFFTSTQRATA